MRPIKGLAVGLAAFSLAGCATDSLSTATAQFSTAVTTTAASEKSYLALVDSAGAVTADAELRRTYLLTGAQVSDLSAAKPAIPATDQAVYDALLGSLMLYGEKLDALASDDQSDAIDDQSTALQKSLSGLNGALDPAGKLSAGDIAIAVTAVEAITNLALDRKRNHEVQAAATDMQKPIHDAVAILQKLNSAYADEIDRDRDGTIGSLAATIRFAPHDAYLFDEVKSEYRSVQAVSSGVDKLNDLLGALEKTNDAVAVSKPVGARVAIQQFVAEAEASYAFYRGLPK